MSMPTMADLAHITEQQRALVRFIVKCIDDGTQYNQSQTWDESTLADWTGKRKQYMSGRLMPNNGCIAYGIWQCWSSIGIPNHIKQREKHQQ